VTLSLSWTCGVVRIPFQATTLADLARSVGLVAQARFDGRIPRLAHLSLTLGRVALARGVPSNLAALREAIEQDGERWLALAREAVRLASVYVHLRHRQDEPEPESVSTEEEDCP
jgi:hypothetical protein